MSAFAKTRCTFCGAHGHSVGILFHGPNHQAICDRCIRLSAALLDGAPLHDDIPGRLEKWRREADNDSEPRAADIPRSVTP